MKRQILFSIMAIIFSACASRRETTASKYNEQTVEQFQHAQMIDSQASRVH